MPMVLVVIGPQTVHADMFPLPVSLDQSLRSLLTWLFSINSQIIQETVPN